MSGIKLMAHEKSVVPRVQPGCEIWGVWLWLERLPGLSRVGLAPSFLLSFVLFSLDHKEN
jgi:hypothetical protein